MYISIQWPSIVTEKVSSLFSPSAWRERHENNLETIWVWGQCFSVALFKMSQNKLAGQLEVTIPCESSRWRFQSRPWGCARIQLPSRWRRVEGWEPEPADGTPALGRTFWDKHNGAKRKLHDEAFRNTMIHLINTWLLLAGKKNNTGIISCLPKYSKTALYSL